MKRHLSLCALALLILVGGGASAQSGTQKVQSGYSGPEDAGTRAAIAAYSERVQQCFQLVGQAKLALKKHDAAKAETLLKQALSFYPEDEEACLRLAEIHMKAKKPEAVVADLDPIVNPSRNITWRAISTYMIDVLAQLDSGNWAAAAEAYTKGFRPNQTWSLPGGGPAHTFPDIQFTPDNPDFLGLKAQAHLILGAYQPHYVEEQDKPQYMLEHLTQVLKYNPKSLDATFLSGFMLAKMERFPEARIAYEKAMRLASPEARPEVEKALQELKAKGDAKVANDIRTKSER